jgi:antitoxin VapB
MNEVRDDQVKDLVGPPMAESREVRLFRNGANQAVRIPREFELPGQQARMWREGDRLIIELVKPQHPKGSPEALLAALDDMAKLEPISVKEFPDVNGDHAPPLDDIVLEAPEA